MNCTKCGKEVAETVKFCDGCGTPLASEQENTQGTVRSASPNQEIKEKRGFSCYPMYSFFSRSFPVRLRKLDAFTQIRVLCF